MLVLAAAGHPRRDGGVKCDEKRIPEALELIDLESRPEKLRNKSRYQALKADPVVQYLVLDCPGQRLLPGLQAMEHRPRRRDDARSGQPDGRLRHHRGLPRIPGLQVDGHTARGDLRRPRGGAAAASHGHHDQRGVSGPVPDVDHGSAPPGVARTGQRRVHAGFGHAICGSGRWNTCCTASTRRDRSCTSPTGRA